jgi:hypothetical protein
MFETGTQTAQYENGQGEYEGGRWRRRRSRWAQDGYGSGEWEQPGYEAGEWEQPGYEAGEWEQPGYEAGEWEQPGYEAGEWEQDYMEGEEEDGEGESEERFLPLIPVVGKVLGGLLGSLVREGEYEEGENGQGEYPEGEAGEAEEEFLDRVFVRVLGQEAEYDEAALSPEQEEQFAQQLMEVADEEELARIIGGIVNAVGRAVQGVRGAVNSPQGRALINAVTPLARAALPAAGGTPSLLELEPGELEREEEGEFEAARRLVQLTSAAAQDVAMAPPGAPPDLVAEASTFRSSRRTARPLYHRALRSISPFARRYHGRRYHGFRRGYRYGRPYRRWGYGPRRYWGGYRRDRYGYRPPLGYPPYAGPGPAPGPEPAPEPPPQPGYRWVAVPIGAPDPSAVPAGPAADVPPPTAAPGGDAPPPEAAGPAAQEEFGRRSRRSRRQRRYRGYGAGGYGAGGYGGDSGDGDGDDGGSGSPSGRWIRRGGRIILLGV